MTELQMVKSSRTREVFRHGFGQLRNRSQAILKFHDPRRRNNIGKGVLEFEGGVDLLSGTRVELKQVNFACRQVEKISVDLLSRNQSGIETWPERSDCGDAPRWELICLVEPEWN